ncbi:MAG TPA: PLDc N-terminal domain-containing protein [Paludibacter sp.]
MKRFLIYFTIALCFISCGSKDKKITQKEFERLFAQDSIGSIRLYSGENEAKIVMKAFHGNSSVTYILPIESARSFEDTFTILRYKMEAQKIHPSYCMVKSDGTEYTPLIFRLFFLCSFILFLIVIIDVLKSRFETATDKLIWFLVLLLPLIGPILYVFIGRKQKLKRN